MSNKGQYHGVHGSAPQNGGPTGVPKLFGWQYQELQASQVSSWTVQP